MDTDTHRFNQTISLMPTRWLQAGENGELTPEATIGKFRLREQVQRNIERFPEDFMFQLSESEVDLMVSQNAIPSRKYLGGSLPHVFTEQGVASLAGVLKSVKAAEVHVRIMRAFVEMRKFIQHNANIFSRLDSVERRQVAFESKTGKKFEKVAHG